MRTRLVVIFTIPGALLFLAIGAAYAVSAARSDQQELFLDRLSDASFLANSARQSLTADDPAIVSGELERYRDVYGIDAAVLNRAGETWASNGLDVPDVEERFAALAGRRSALSTDVMPWNLDDLNVAEPVFDGGDLIGAVVTSSSTDQLSRGTWLNWGLLLAGGLVTLVLAIVVANWLATWVMRPVRAVEGAIGEMGRGRLDARIPESTGPPELRHLIERFNQMAQKVERLMLKQQEFVANASHELRNPLNALLLRAEDLALTLPDKDATEVESLRAEGRRMARILDALLMLARDQDAGATSDPVNVSAVVMRRRDGWAPIARASQVELRFTGSDDTWARVDEIVLESAVDAVIDNAVKFSPAGSPVELSVAVQDATVEIAIRDHGPGLHPDEVEKVTDRFWRSADHITVKGSGLGLAIASELLNSADGSVHVSPADGGGLRVVLRIPRASVVA